VNFWGNGATEYLLVDTEKSSLVLLSGPKRIEGQILSMTASSITATFPSVTSQPYTIDVSQNQTVLDYHHPNGMLQRFTAE